MASLISSAKSLLQLSLLLLCFANFLAPTTASSSSSSSMESETKRAVRARRHPKSRQRSANTECILGYRQRIEHHCRYPNTEKPCFQQTESGWTKAVEEAAKKCCDTGLCSVEDFEDLCCRTMECLERCYGPSFLQRIRNRFRYFDILIRPHPHSKGRNGREAADDEDKDGLEAEAAADEEEAALIEEELKQAAEEMSQRHSQVTAKAVDDR